MTISILNSTSNQCCGSVSGSVGSVPIFWCLQDPILLLFCTDPFISLNKQKCKKYHDSYYFVTSFWQPLTRKVGSESGSVSQCYESADLDPYQNVKDPQHCFQTFFVSWRSCYRKDILKFKTPVLFVKGIGSQDEYFLKAWMIKSVLLKMRNWVSIFMLPC
jgi:hypothetical protein